MSKQVVFVEGMRAFKPNAKAPSYVKGNLKINRYELMMWLDKQPEEINIDLKESQKGGYYLSVSDYKPKQDGSIGFQQDVRVTAEDDDTLRARVNNGTNWLTPSTVDDTDSLPF